MNVDWSALFVPQSPVVEIVLRGTIMYLALFVLLRLLVRRHAGEVSLTDLLLLVLIADAAQNGMAGDYRSIPEGIILCATLVAWNYALDSLAYFVPAVRPWLEPPPLLLVKDGQILRRHMRKELITEDELLSLLREQGVVELNEIKAAYIEPDGQISVVKSQPR